jgi:hypothetical protein
MKLGRRRCASGNAARTEMVVSEGAITPRLLHAVNFLTPAVSLKAARSAEGDFC